MASSVVLCVDANTQRGKSYDDFSQADISETLNCIRMIMYVSINPIIEAPDEEFMSKVSMGRMGARDEKESQSTKVSTSSVSSAVSLLALSIRIL